MLGAILGGVLALVAVAVLIVWMFVRPTPEKNPPPESRLARTEFNSKVVGRTEDEVFRDVGPPDFTSKDSEALYWHYRKRTTDPVTGAADTDAQVVFRDGKAVRVNY
jgi:hypothetical protein